MASSLCFDRILHKALDLQNLLTESPRRVPRELSILSILSRLSCRPLGVLRVLIESSKNIEISLRKSRELSYGISRVSRSLAESSDIFEGSQSSQPLQLGPLEHRVERTESSRRSRNVRREVSMLSIPPRLSSRPQTVSRASRASSEIIDRFPSRAFSTLKKTPREIPRAPGQDSYPSRKFKGNGRFQTHYRYTKLLLPYLFGGTMLHS